MFTGLIKEVAKVTSFQNNFLRLQSMHRPNLGDSIAINGVCLSVTNLFEGGFEVELSIETKAVVAIENFSEFVHMEPAMRLGDRVEGHMVQGHVDYIGEVMRIEHQDNGYNIYVQVPKEAIKLIVPKGSIAIDGVSLTINDVYEESFRLTIIPITYQETNFKRYEVGTRVNIETDMFARYLAHMFSREEKLSWSDVDSVMARW